MQNLGIEAFQRLPVDEVAQLVREHGPKVCVFPINGTRRWFMLEHPQAAAEDFVQSYLRITWQRQMELYRLFFDHGITTLVTPIFGPDLLERGTEYEQLMQPGIAWCARDQALLDFYRAYDVRVRVYGDAARHLRNTRYAFALEDYAELTRRTADHERNRLFFGVCAHDATETVAEIGVCFHQQHGRLPNRREIVETYYGEYVEPVDFFIGFDRLSAFDMPLIATGNEDLYFTISPSPYLDVRALRAILYDHLYARRVDESTYSGLSSEGWAYMRAFYQANVHSVLGLGVNREGVWYPLPQAVRPDEGEECDWDG